MVNEVMEFTEKPQAGGGWINGGFLCLRTGNFRLSNAMIKTILEREPLERLAADHQLMAFRHAGFWQPMDTIRDKEYLEECWASGQAPWKIWN